MKVIKTLFISLSLTAWSVDADSLRKPIGGKAEDSKQVKDAKRDLARDQNYHLSLSDPSRFAYSEYDEESKKLLCTKECLFNQIAVFGYGGICECVDPCNKVCRSVSLVCNGEYGEGSHWEAWENKRCWAWDRVQSGSGIFGGLSKMKLRLRCKCPERDYSVSDACAPSTQANLANCIIGEIDNGGSYEINFGDLTNVQIGRVYSHGEYWDVDDYNGYDIDFQGDVSGSHFCELESEKGDIEFGGEACPITFSGNSVRSVVVGKDFKFEEGAWVTENFFGSVTADDDFQFNGSGAAIRDTKITDNSFADIDIADKCNWNDGHDEGDADIDGNSCTGFNVADDGDCDVVFDGFDCV
mmetsp:Transcript_10565/g.22737  ORF Transcript_10565/g.22737 Transcript_10565/m.22737 type:complete len:355 (+) Transcript_10565:46-1110(+)